MNKFIVPHYERKCFVSYANDSLMISCLNTQTGQLNLYPHSGRRNFRFKIFIISSLKLSSVNLLASLCITVSANLKLRLSSDATDIK